MVLIERLGKPLQAGGRDFCISANADTKVIGHLEESSRHHAGVIFFPQKIAEVINAATAQAGENGGAVGRQNAFQIISGSHK